MMAMSAFYGRSEQISMDMARLLTHIRVERAD
jgi:hypothetical protein